VYWLLINVVVNAIANICISLYFCVDKRLLYLTLWAVVYIFPTGLPNGDIHYV